jgi:hypothetical protein
VVDNETASGRSDDSVIPAVRTTTRSLTEDGQAARHEAETARLMAQLDALNEELHQEGILRVKAEQKAAFAVAGLEVESKRKTTKADASLKKMLTDVIKKHNNAPSGASKVDLKGAVRSLASAADLVTAAAAEFKAAGTQGQSPRAPPLQQALPQPTADHESLVSTALAREDVHRLQLQEVHKAHHAASERALMAVLHSHTQQSGRSSGSSGSRRARDRSRSPARSRSRDRRHSDYYYRPKRSRSRGRPLQ